MSASNTNVEVQKRRHKGPILGISIVLVWAAVLFGGFLVWTVYQPANPTAESPAEVLSD